MSEKQEKKALLWSLTTGEGYEMVHIHAYSGTQVQFLSAPTPDDPGINLLDGERKVFLHFDKGIWEQLRRAVHPTGRNEEPQDLPALDTARIVGNLANGIARSLEQIVKAVVEANR